MNNHWTNPSAQGPGWWLAPAVVLTNVTAAGAAVIFARWHSATITEATALLSSGASWWASWWFAGSVAMLSATIDYVWTSRSRSSAPSATSEDLGTLPPLGHTSVPRSSWALAVDGWRGVGFLWASATLPLRSFALSAIPAVVLAAGAWWAAGWYLTWAAPVWWIALGLKAVAVGVVAGLSRSWRDDLRMYAR